ncbi:hypothetical protein D1632_12485 [Chryseobacterium nematophagum]|uniref:Lipoprotein n=1 Tax=Chryseobacterium nematophagum TaxID=2305228 RepID=A0A3M7L6T5_9FLAO|nr:hypothetical protein [Chryseobacterium nematophagum]RMZ58433.1 hypothetical protein D1632_12485 [Chryseobacterium nematophagum]
MNIKYYIKVVLVALAITGCKKNHQTDEKRENQLFEFSEVGSKELLTIEFPQEWKIHPYESSSPISESDMMNESNLNKLDYFDNVKGKPVKTRNYISFLSEKGFRLDSIFVMDSISNKGRTFVYLKIFKTIEDPNYDFPQLYIK